jgi:tRNA(fMet)-specific endonuclease VapC
MLHMLDIDTASYIVRSRAAQVEAKLSAIEPSMLCISAMTRAELLYGLKRLSPDHRLRAGVHQFLKIVRALPWGAEAADLYAEMRNQLAAAGQLIGEIDMMIAAHSLATAAVLVTNTLRHYQRIPVPLILENWWGAGAS